jgi:hypothetical protein
MRTSTVVFSHCKEAANLSDDLTIRLLQLVTSVWMTTIHLASSTTTPMERIQMKGNMFNARTFVQGAGTIAGERRLAELLAFYIPYVFSCA